MMSVTAAEIFGFGLYSRPTSRIASDDGIIPAQFKRATPTAE
jgi:hypothetical protein